MTCDEVVTWRDALIDGELDLMRQLSVEQHLKGCTACAARVEERRALQNALRTQAPRFQAPPALEARLQETLKGPSAPAPVSRNWQGWWGGFVSAALATSALWIVVPYLATHSHDQRLAQDVINSHVRSLMSDHLTDVISSNQHVVKPWFNGRVDFSPTTKDLATQGFPLAGGRLDHVDNRTVAALAYHHALHPINLFTWPAKNSREIPPQALSRRGYHLIYWTSGGMVYWVISDLNERELQNFIELIRS